MKPNFRIKLITALSGLLVLTAPMFTARADDVTYLYDANGRTKSATGIGWSAVYDYDAAGNVIQITRTAPIALLGVVSRKTHGTAGTYDLPLDRSVPVDGAVTVEPRSVGGAHSIVFQFNSTITSPGAVGVGRGAAPIGNVAALTGSGTEVSVDVANIPDNKRVTVTLTGVNGGSGTYLVSIGFLKGDVNNSRSVNSSDISSVKAWSGQSTTPGNFLRDLNASGDINSSDISAVKAQSGLVLEP